MQTFLPYTDFIKSAKCLDYKRLGKQRVEAKQILNILLNETDKKGWCNHPAVLMWKGYEWALKVYYHTMLQEWEDRGYKNNMSYYPTSCWLDDYTCEWDITDFIVYPSWLTDEFCSRHRSALLAKDFEYYKKFNWVEESKYEYLWPTKVGK
ncbi:MAG: MSMEG_6728 family protein [Candidatus Dojkabacteria bacterium]